MRGRFITGAAGLLVFAALIPPVGADPVIVEGVPRTGWAVGRFCQSLDCLHAALTAMGCPMGYDELLVASGAAFQAAWWPGRYSYAAPEACPEDLFIIGAGAAGASVERRDHATPEGAWATVRESLDAGRPCLARRGQGWRVICGYDARNRVMYKRDYNTSTPDYDVVPFEAPEAPWPFKGGHQIILLNYDPAAEPPTLDWPAILERAIRLVDWPAAERVLGVFVCGLGAYDAWAEALRSGPDGNGAQTDAELVEFVVLNMMETRSAASVVLQQNATVHEVFADAAVYYMAEAELLSTLPTTLAAGVTQANRAQFEAAMARGLDNPALREQSAQIVEQAREQEVLAADCLREALADLRGETAEPEPAVGPAAADDDAKAAAQAHLQRGRELKNQRRFAEAATELRAAIAGDPELVEAHRVLAWVLVELKQEDEAAAEFRKVIELAPDSDQAKEAQKALERLGR